MHYNISCNYRKAHKANQIDTRYTAVVNTSMIAVSLTRPKTNQKRSNEKFNFQRFDQPAIFSKVAPDSAGSSQSDTER